MAFSIAAFWSDFAGKVGQLILAVATAAVLVFLLAISCHLNPVHSSLLRNEIAHCKISFAS